MEQRIKTRTIIELMGSPKEHVENTMKSVIEKVKERKKSCVITEQVFDAQQIEGKPFWSTFCEFEIDYDNLESMVGFCFDFMPSSIEILEPESMDFNQETITSLVNDLLARLHQYDMLVKNLHAENILLKRKNEGTIKK